jgi:multicomponent Na+:H+ antiporter subunit C
MSVASLFGLCAAGLVGVGLYGLIVLSHPLRKIISFNVMGSGVFVLFGAVARRGAAAGFGADPVPQALLITGIVVAFSATALAVALVVRLIEATGSATLASEAPPRADLDVRRD